jgi:heme oxygenase-like protein
MSIEPAPCEVSFSAELFERLGPAVDAVARRRSAQHWNPADPELLRRWFLLVWQSVQASVPLLEAATAQLGLWPQTSFTELLGEYYTLHALEEQAHDEWLLDDLADLGVEAHSAFLEPPDRHIAAMVGSQYYLIRHYHPALLLGYIAFCEGHPPRPEAIERLRASSVTSPQVWRTYRFHARQDPLHLEELCAVLDEVPLEPEPLRQAIVANALGCVDAYDAVVDSLFPPAAQFAQRALTDGSPRE